MITVIMLALIQNNLCFSESLGIAMLECCFEGFLLLPLYHKKWHGIKGYFSELKNEINLFLCNF